MIYYLEMQRCKVIASVQIKWAQAARLRPSGSTLSLQAIGTIPLHARQQHIAAKIGWNDFSGGDPGFLRVHIIDVKVAVMRHVRWIVDAVADQGKDNLFC